MLSSLSVPIQSIYKLYLIRDQAISLALLELPGDKYCSKIWSFMTVILPDSTTGSHTVESTNAHKGAHCGHRGEWEKLMGAKRQRPMVSNWSAEMSSWTHPQLCSAINGSPRMCSVDCSELLFTAGLWSLLESPSISLTCPSCMAVAQPSAPLASTKTKLLAFTASFSESSR